MRFRSAALGITLMVTALIGCEASHPTDAPTVDMFAPTAMRIHPIFTQLTDRNHTGKPDGIEAYLEFQDQFGDPTKASGRVLFELFDYRRDSPDPRGRRVGGPWVGALDSLDEQHARWNTTLRTYRFQLNYPEVRPDKSYVLTSVLELSGGGRFFDRIVLKGVDLPNKKEKNGAPSRVIPSLQSFDEPDANRPTSRPTTRAGDQ